MIGYSRDGEAVISQNPAAVQAVEEFSQGLMAVHCLCVPPR
jgi:hypothetical protein